MNNVRSTLELIDPGVMCDIAMEAAFLNRICSVANSRNIGWNYVVDYTWVWLQFKMWLSQWPSVSPQAATILDIGVGPGVLHYYLEYTYGVNIVGIDRQEKWPSASAKVDVVGDFTEPKTQEESLKGKKADLILAISSFEHNDYAGHKAVVDSCIDCLAPGGWLIATVSTNTESTFSDDQWDLSPGELGEIYQADPPTNGGYIHERWRGQMDLASLYKKRYGRWDESSPHFIVAGAVVSKEP